MGLALAGPVAAADSFDLAVTVDDLPVHGPLPAGMSWLGIAESHVASFKAHGVPEAFGFVNAAKLKKFPESAAALDAWRKAGHPLGNHTFTHMNLDKAPSIEAWQDDVVLGEPDVASRMQGADWHYLRYPFLVAGGPRHDAALTFLKGRGYKIADVSLSFSDWAYTDTYARCVAKGDTQAIAAMKSYYLKSVDQEIALMKTRSKQVYGRIIPQVLLTHMGGWSAVTLPDVLARLDAAGARYVTLAKAQSDPAYALSGSQNMIEREAAKRGITLTAGEAILPALDVNSLCN
ncbi:MAG: polysaccharide deacetylase family protein [Massilia sp.]